MTTSIQVSGSTFSKVRTRAAPVHFSRARSLQFFGRDAASSAKNRLPNPASDAGVMVGAPVYSDAFVTFANQSQGFSSNLLGGGASAPFTQILVCTRPVITGGAAGGVYCGHYADANNVRDSISYQATANLNLLINDAVRANRSVNQGTTFMFVAATNDGTGGDLAYGGAGSLTSISYAHAPTGGKYPWKVGAGGNAADLHSWSVAAAIEYADRLTLAELAEEYEWLMTVNKDRGLAMV